MEAAEGGECRVTRARTMAGGRCGGDSSSELYSSVGKPNFGLEASYTSARTQQAAHALVQEASAGMPHTEEAGTHTSMKAQRREKC